MGQNVVVGSMLVLRVALGNVPGGVWLDPRLYHKDTSPRLGGELSLFGGLGKNPQFLPLRSLLRGFLLAVKCDHLIAGCAELVGVVARKTIATLIEREIHLPTLGKEDLYALVWCSP